MGGSLNELTPCIEPNCPNKVWRDSRCRKHYTPFRGHNRAARLPKDWTHRKAAVLLRDGFRCALCGGGGADSVDHIVPAQEQPDGQDDHSMENLRAIHQNNGCQGHRAKTAQEGNNAKKSARAYNRRFNDSP